MARLRITVTDTERGELLHDFHDVQAYVLAIMDQNGGGEVKYHGWPLFLIETGGHLVLEGIELNEKNVRAESEKMGLRVN